MDPLQIKCLFKILLTFEGNFLYFQYTDVGYPPPPILAGTVAGIVSGLGAKRKVRSIPTHTIYITCGKNSLKYTFHETCCCLRFLCAMLFLCLQKCHMEDFYCHVYTIKIHPRAKTKRKFSEWVNISYSFSQYSKKGIRLRIHIKDNPYYWNS